MSINRWLDKHSVRKADEWLPVGSQEATGAVGEKDYKGKWENFEGGNETLIILISGMVSWEQSCFKAYQIVYFIQVQLTECQLHLTKAEKNIFNPLNEFYFRGKKIKDLRREILETNIIIVAAMISPRRDWVGQTSWPK